MDNSNLISACSENGDNIISVYEYNKDEDSYENIKDFEVEATMLSALVKLDKNKFLCGTMDNTIEVYNEDGEGLYKLEKEVKLPEKDDFDCIYALIKISNGNFISTGFDLVKLINPDFQVIKDITFSQPSCLFEDSKKKIWIGNSPGSILVVDSELNKIREILAHDLQINKFVEFEKYIISASTDFTMKIWDLNSYECVNTIEGFGEITAVSLLEDGSLVSAQGIPPVEKGKHYKEKDLLQYLVFYEKEDEKDK